VTLVLELDEKLTPDELQQVKNFAEFLLARRAANVQTPAATAQRKYVDVKALAGLCAGMGADKTDVELAHEATEIRAAKFDR
jgi:hypothetical protein